MTKLAKLLDNSIAFFFPQERNKPQRTLEAEPEESKEESEQTYLDELLVPEPWELNNTARAGTDILFFNRVPKVGSQTFMELLRRLAIKNQFGKVLPHSNCSKLIY